MPRGRGGARTGTPGKAYQNRTDLHGANVVSAQPANTGAKLPVATATGQPYGAATVQKNAQQTVAMAGTQTPTPQPVAGGAPSAPVNPLSGVTPLTQPTTHGLPITHGIAAGAGAGPEVMMQTIQTNPAQQALAQLNSLGSNVSPQVNFIRNYLALQAENQGPQ